MDEILTGRNPAGDRRLLAALNLRLSEAEDEPNQPPPPIPIAPALTASIELDGASVRPRRCAAAL